MSRLRKLTEADLPLLLSWRNDPTISRYMFNKKPISLEEHRQWYLRVAHNEAYTLLIFEQDGVALGHMNFTQNTDTAIAEWGFYISPDAARGAGSTMGACALELAFEELHFHKVSAQVLNYNERSLHMHHKLGFKQEDVLRSHHFDGESYHDIHCFGLLADERRN
ncbi:UDP-4-amino-4,6-dideoxy-N-acetyl-beta-L-altrosamine N-acetyltransferase [Pseudomonas sp. AU11447]|uniref:UDP-4-amino-4, 6-dideoxy-N-acetyl-beta-L-altrosamine N-acetyltransferase n=1 Tax=unclassified Pseudomonas TaxID=196821 RepID=UPI0006D4327B|nr:MULTISPECIES: UDP-4-amino-4,6-dideoxy-N-acetyl-beta-L-altrosamine N-acetyltransferase [unclassified Pseudomonas]OBY92287.1 UDP-4-amino-4,6-dideoxy-N-acetyl-beta-L-altrosamine N-acetyltransferase [Pseudomonas sp. AU11447]